MLFYVPNHENLIKIDNQIFLFWSEMDYCFQYNFYYVFVFHDVGLKRKEEFKLPN